jgi:hypothetical protein
MDLADCGHSNGRPPWFLFCLLHLFWRPSNKSHAAGLGTFGDFIGGITNPIISLFALLAVLLTLMVQSKQLEATREELDRTREAAEAQAANLKKEAKKSDIYRTLQVLENRLEKLYREPIYFPSEGRLEEWELYLLLSHATDDVLKKIPPLTDLGPPEYRNEYLRTKATLTQLHITLVKLSTQLTSLVYVDDGEEFSFFYEPTISYMASKLKLIGYLPSPDDETIEHNREFRNTVRESRRQSHSTSA